MGPESRLFFSLNLPRCYTCAAVVLSTHNLYNKYTMTEYIILTAIIAFVVGYKVAELLGTMALREILNDLGIKESQLRSLIAQENSEDSPLQEVELRIEQIEGQLLAYEQQPEVRFVAQCPTAELLLERLVEFYPVNTRLNISRTDGSDLMQHLLGSKTP